MKAPPSDLSARLLEASHEILRLDGAVRLDDVAATVGVPRATLYYYFSGRDDLTAYLLIRHLEDGAEALDAVSSDGEGAATRLRAVLVATLEFLARHPGVCGGLLSAMGSGVGMEEVMSANDRVIAARLRDLLVQGQESGELTFGDAADTANLMLGAALIAVLARAIAGRPLNEQGFIASTADQLFRMVASNPRETA